MAIFADICGWKSRSREVWSSRANCVKEIKDTTPSGIRGIWRQLCPDTHDAFGDRSIIAFPSPFKAYAVTCECQ
jgi:hypothetical protein